MSAPAVKSTRDRSIFIDKIKDNTWLYICLRKEEKKVFNYSWYPAKVTNVSDTNQKPLLDNIDIGLSLAIKAKQINVSILNETNIFQSKQFILCDSGFGVFADLGWRFANIDESEALDPFKFIPKEITFIYQDNDTLAKKLIEIYYSSSTDYECFKESVLTEKGKVNCVKTTNYLASQRTTTTGKFKFSPALIYILRTEDAAPAPVPAPAAPAAAAAAAAAAAPAAAAPAQAQPQTLSPRHGIDPIMGPPQPSVNFADRARFNAVMRLIAARLDSLHDFFDDNRNKTTKYSDRTLFKGLILQALDSNKYLNIKSLKDIVKKMLNEKNLKRDIIDKFDSVFDYILTRGLSDRGSSLFSSIFNTEKIKYKTPDDKVIGFIEDLNNEYYRADFDFCIYKEQFEFKRSRQSSDVEANYLKKARTHLLSIGTNTNQDLLLELKKFLKKDRIIFCIDSLWDNTLFILPTSKTGSQVKLQTNQIEIAKFILHDWDASKALENMPPTSPTDCYPQNRIEKDELDYVLFSKMNDKNVPTNFNMTYASKTVTHYKSNGPADRVVELKQETLVKFSFVNSTNPRDRYFVNNHNINLDSKKDDVQEHSPEDEFNELKTNLASLFECCLPNDISMSTNHCIKFSDDIEHNCLTSFDRIKAALDVKRSGDALQIIRIKRLNDENTEPGKLYVFVTIDKIAFLIARLYSIPAILIHPKNKGLLVYNPPMRNLEHIRIESLGFQDPTRVEQNIDDKEYNDRYIRRQLEHKDIPCEVCGGRTAETNERDLLGVCVKCKFCVHNLCNKTETDTTYKDYYCKICDNNRDVQIKSYDCIYFSSCKVCGEQGNTIKCTVPYCERSYHIDCLELDEIRTRREFYHLETKSYLYDEATKHFICPVCFYCTKEDNGVIYYNFLEQFTAELEKKYKGVIPEHVRSLIQKHTEAIAVIKENCRSGVALPTSSDSVPTVSELSTGDAARPSSTSENNANDSVNLGDRPTTTASESAMQVQHEDYETDRMYNQIIERIKEQYQKIVNIAEIIKTINSSPIITPQFNVIVLESNDQEGTQKKITHPLRQEQLAYVFELEKQIDATIVKYEFPKVFRLELRTRLQIDIIRSAFIECDYWNILSTYKSEILIDKYKDIFSRYFMFDPTSFSDRVLQDKLIKLKLHELISMSEELDAEIKNISDLVDTEFDANNVAEGFYMCKYENKSSINFNETKYGILLSNWEKELNQYLIFIAKDGEMEIDGMQEPYVIIKKGLDKLKQGLTIENPPFLLSIRETLQFQQNPNSISDYAEKLNEYNQIRSDIFQLSSSIRTRLTGQLLTKISEFKHNASYYQLFKILEKYVLQNSRVAVGGERKFHDQNLFVNPSTIKLTVSPSASLSGPLSIYSDSTRKSCESDGSLKTYADLLKQLKNPYENPSVFKNLHEYVYDHHLDTPDISSMKLLSIHEYLDYMFMYTKDAFEYCFAEFFKSIIEAESNQEKAVYNALTSTTKTVPKTSLKDKVLSLLGKKGGSIKKYHEKYYPTYARLYYDD